MKKIILAILVILLLAGAYYFISPLLRTDEVNEDFPITSLNEAAINDLVQVPGQPELDAMTDEARMAVERSIVEKMNDFDPVVVDESMKEGMTNDAKVMMEEDNNEPQVLASGTFIDADNFHKGSGSATVYELPDASQLLRLENFEVTNGPDLFVYLVKDVNNVDADYLDLGRLKGNKGNQNYPIPNEIDISEYSGVVIWCKAFSVLFSPASF